MFSFPNSVSNIVDVLRYRAKTTPNDVLYRFLSNGEGEGETLSYNELDQAAQTIATKLLSVATPGDRALLLYPDGLEFIKAFFGCLYAGLIAVPAFPPKRNQKMHRLQSILSDSEPSIVLSEVKAQAIVRSMLSSILTNTSTT